MVLRVGSVVLWRVGGVAALMLGVSVCVIDACRCLAICRSSPPFTWVLSAVGLATSMSRCSSERSAQASSTKLVVAIEF